MSEHRTFEASEVLQGCEHCQCECGCYLAPAWFAAHPIDKIAHTCPRCGVGVLTDAGMRAALLPMDLGDVHG